MSSDGKRILFRSLASDLAAGDGNGAGDLYIHDADLEANILLTRSADWTGSANGHSGRAVLVDNGSRVIFESHAPDVVSQSSSLQRDIYVLDLGDSLADSDNDQLPDEWELTFFGNLEQDGTADNDGDGLLDLGEFRSGTSPAESGSVLQAISVTNVATGTATIRWQSVVGRRYQVQYKDSVDALEWETLPTVVTASSSVAATTDGAENTKNRRFYRVIMVE
jgi:hypothetical protein